MSQSGVDEYQSKPAINTREAQPSENLPERESENSQGDHRREIGRVAFVAAAAIAFWFLGRSTNP